MPRPTVSVIMPVYNQEALVGCAIQSILNQSYSDFEFIIVDDGSTDNTTRVIEGFDDPRIRLIKADHKGFIEALRLATLNANGKWLARMDSDDISMPTRLEKQLAFLEEHPECKFVTTTYGILTPRNKVLVPAESDEWRYITAKDISLNTVPFCDPGTMYDREAAARLGYDNEFGLEKTLWYMMLREGKGALLERSLYFIRWRIGSVSRGQYTWPKDFGFRVRSKYDPVNANGVRAPRPQNGPSAIEKKTVYYCVGAGDFATARKTAFRLWLRQPIHPEAAKLVLYSFGYRTPKEIYGPAGLRMWPISISDVEFALGVNCPGGAA